MCVIGYLDYNKKVKDDGMIKRWNDRRMEGLNDELG